MKRQRNIMVQQNFFNSLPHNLITDILVRVAAHSFKDFINVKLCCRGWNELGEDGYVLKHLSLHEFKEWKLLLPESEEYKRKSSWLVNKCADAGNVEALYRKGLVGYIGGSEPEKGLQWLNDAANAGHGGAEYAAAMISILRGSEEGWESGTLRLKGMMQCKELRKKAIDAHVQMINTHVKARDYRLRTLPVNWSPHRRYCTDSHHELQFLKVMGAVFKGEEVGCLCCICDAHINQTLRSNIASVKRQKNIMVQQNFFDSLPHNLIIDILVRVAAHSFKDFINVKLCCREWNELAEDGYMLKHLSLHEFKEWKLKVPESEEYKRKSSWLVNKCADAAVIDYLASDKQVGYLGGKEPEKGLQCLKNAANSGHAGAEYAAAMISILGGDEEDWESGTLRLKAMMQCKESRIKAIDAPRQLMYTHIKARDYRLGRLPVKLSDRRCCTASDHTFSYKKIFTAAYAEEGVGCLCCLCDAHISLVYLTLSTNCFCVRNNDTVVLRKAGIIKFLFPLT
nr:putative F-box protein At1g67623 [Ipomoea batatas]